MTHRWSTRRLLERAWRPGADPARVCWRPQRPRRGPAVSPSPHVQRFHPQEAGVPGGTRPGSRRRNRLAGFWFCEGPALLQARLCAAHRSAPGRKHRRPGPAVGALGRRPSPECSLPIGSRERGGSAQRSAGSHVVTGHQARVCKVRAPAPLTQPQGSGPL